MISSKYERKYITCIAAGRLPAQSYLTCHSLSGPVSVCLACTTHENHPEPGVVPRASSSSRSEMRASTSPAGPAFHPKILN